MKAQKVCGVRRITVRRDGQVLNTKHLILTFSTPDLPQSVKAAYIHCQSDPIYQILCAASNASNTGTPKMFLLPYLNQREKIPAVKIEDKISYPKARRIVYSRTPVSEVSYASAVKRTFNYSSTQTEKYDFKECSESPTKTKGIAKSYGNSPSQNKNKGIVRTASNSPQKPKGLSLGAEHPKTPEEIIQSVQKVPPYLRSGSDGLAYIRR
ncbi:hypothetical protein TNCV_1935801 [Trichonephila clavipes]|nr:hypothetical protein TNCV_1935801 [Trichonephila clavipes]